MECGKTRHGFTRWKLEKFVRRVAKLAERLYSFIEKVGCVRPPFSDEATTSAGLHARSPPLIQRNSVCWPFATTHSERRRHLSVLTVILAKMRSLVSH